MCSRSIFVSLTMAAALAACGGGGPSPSDIAQAPESDPTASWPVKPILGTWTGNMSPPGGCGDTSAQGAQTLAISSSDGLSYIVKATPAIGFPKNLLLPGSGSADETLLQWSGEPAFTVTKQDLRWSYYWEFKVVASGQAEVRSQYASLINGVVETYQCKGTLTRSN